MPLKKRLLRKKVKRAPRRKTATVSQAVKKYVKRTISSTLENKSVQINAGAGFGNVLESPDLNAYPMMPITGLWTIPQAIGQGGRIGNEIKIKSCHLNYIIIPRGYDAISNAVPVPCNVDLYLGHLRGTPNIQPVAADVGLLFQNGSSVAAPVGSLRDMVSIVNKDFWVIKKRWSHKVGFATNQGTGSQVGSQYYANNDFKLNAMRKLNITHMVPKTVRFNDTQNTALSKNLFFMYQAVSANGGTLSSSQIPLSIEYWIDVQYEDA